MKFRLFLYCFLFVVNGLSPAEDGKPCCLYNANSKPIFRNLVSFDNPPLEGSCRWVPDYPAQVQMLDRDRSAIALHYDCFSTDAKIMHSFDNLLEVEVSTGRVVNKISWSDRSLSSPQMLVISDGRMLVLLGPDLEVYSFELKPIASWHLNAAHEPGENIQAYLSSDRTRVVVRQYLPKETSSVDHWISLPELQETYVHQAEHSGAIAVGKSAVYYWPVGKTEVRSYDQKGHDSRLSDICAGVPELELFSGEVILDNHDGLSFVGPDGSVRRHLKYGTALDYAMGFTWSLDTTRFAFHFGHLQSMLFMGKDRQEVAVFDVPANKVILHLKGEQKPQKEKGGEFWPGVRISLAPDGSRLAVLSGQFLYLYNLPSANAPKH
jgi:hypothetical protein